MIPINGGDGDFEALVGDVETPALCARRAKAELCWQRALWPRYTQDFKAKGDGKRRPRISVFVAQTATGFYFVICCLQEIRPQESEREE